MTVEKWIQIAVGGVTGLVLSLCLFLIQYLADYMTGFLLTSESFLVKSFLFITYSLNGIFLLLVCFVTIYSLQKNKKLAVKIANAVLLVATFFVIYQLTFV